MLVLVVVICYLVSVVDCFVFVLDVSGTMGIAFIFFLMIRRPPRSTLDRSSAASDVYKRQEYSLVIEIFGEE